ncbi:hypothetical protein HHI36_014381, partial [Cryptolaemus montrouzieri]
MIADVFEGYFEHLLDLIPLASVIVTAKWRVLVRELERRRISSYLINLIESYLEDRKINTPKDMQLIAYADDLAA